MRAVEFVSEKWSAKYKRSINCSNPQGFSQRAHCQGRKKNEDLNEFAPSGDEGGNDPEDVLLRFAKMWYSAPDVATQRKVEQALAKIGWEIGELESDDGGAFVMRIGDDEGRSYLAWSEEQLAQLNELSFLGSQCTKDCSGHRAGYEWSQRKGGVDAASWSPSFNKGAWLHNNGF